MGKIRNTKNSEFDSYADSYYDNHKQNIKITGESPEYFSEYKIADLNNHIKKKRIIVGSIFDFGCGIGNSVPYFRKYFPDSKLNFGDVSKKSINIARKRFPGNESYYLISDNIPLPSASMDLVYAACVFHHIDEMYHLKWLSELKRITKHNGLIVIYEHNPYNPLTLYAVNKCEFDINAKLISSKEMSKKVQLSCWGDVIVEYKLFFPKILKFLRPLEKYLSWCSIGGQWCLIAKKK